MTRQQLLIDKFRVNNILEKTVEGVLNITPSVLPVMRKTFLFKY